MDILLTFLNRHHPLFKVVIAIVLSHYRIFRDGTKRINIKMKFVSITKNFNPKGQYQLQKYLFYPIWWVKCQNFLLLFQNGMDILLTFLNRHHPLLKVTIAIVQSHYKIFGDGTKRIIIGLNLFLR